MTVESERDFLMYVRLLSVLALVLCCSFSYAEEKVDMSLDKVWALNMPGTHRLTLDRRGPQSGYVSKYGALAEAIYSFLLGKSDDPELGPVLVLEGSGLEALKNLKAVLDNKREASTSFSTKQEISVVFFAIGRHENVHLTRVLWTGSEVQLYYKFVPYLIGPQTTVHFAIIPLGKLPKGVVKVNLYRLPFAENSTISPYRIPTREEVKRIVCQPVEFKVE